MVVGGEERQGRAQGGPRLAVPGAGQEHRRHGAARQRLAPVARREQRRSGEGAEALDVVGDVVARELLAGLRRHGNGAAEIEGQGRGVGEDAEHGAGAAAAGGMAAFSDGVRLMGAGSQRVSATSARPATPETPTYTRAAVRLPPATRLRVAASASAGINGSTYCGSLD